MTLGWEIFLDQESITGDFCLVELEVFADYDITFRGFDRRLQASWWRHQMVTFSALLAQLLALCAGNSQVNSLYKGQWHRALMFYLICAWIKGWANNQYPGDLRCHHDRYDVTVMLALQVTCLLLLKADKQTLKCVFCIHVTKVKVNNFLLQFQDMFMKARIHWMITMVWKICKCVFFVNVLHSAIFQLDSCLNNKFQYMIIRLSYLHNGISFFTLVRKHYSLRMWFPWHIYIY